MPTAKTPLGGCTLDTAAFGEMARRVADLAAELEVPAGAVLEGGYDLNALAASVVAMMEELTAT